MSKDYSSIPANACTFAAELEIGDNGEDAKTAPIRMLARSSKPIEHYYWGNVVHDISGFNLNGKNRLPIDFDHDTGQAIGFANRFEQTPEGLVMSGTIVSHGGDRAEKIMKDMRAGIPYEASINFGGDGIRVEDVPAGTTAQVNGYEFTDGCIVRNWPLRGVAVCLYGADMNTASNVFSEGTKFSAQLVEPQTETATMPETTKPASEVAEAAVELAQVEAVEATETAPVELTQAVEEDTAEVAEAAVEAVEAEAEVVEEATFTAAEFATIVTNFGQDIAVQVATNGGNYADAKELHHQAEKAELEALRKENAELKARPAPVTGAKPASFSSTDTPGKPAKKNINDAAVRRTK